MEAIERFDGWMCRAGAVALIVVGTGLLIWAALILSVQCLAWLKSGQWQPVPAFAFMLNPHAQTVQLVPLGLLDAWVSPLAVVPSVGPFDTPEDVSASIGGNLLGMRKIASTLISWPLALWAALLGVICTSAATSLLSDEC